MNEIVSVIEFNMRPIEALKGYHFFVDSYQRGYKWTAQQVIELLEDIDEFAPEAGGIYPLQPVITKLIPGSSTHKYELIDGQQRITTIYLILQSTNHLKNYYEIDYATRNSSRDFLNQIHTIQTLILPNADFSNPNALQTSIGKYWQEYIDKGSHHFDNPDNYHFYIAWQIINQWFATHDKTVFCEKLLKYAQVIWYQVAETAVSQEVFRNINSGKVTLNSSELIKALFLLSCKDDANKEISNLRQSEIAGEWDLIERALHNDELWFFLYKNKKQKRGIAKYTTRIDLLFDLLTHKTDRDDAFFSYRQYDKMWRDGKLEWQPVKELFQKFHEWFEDRELYHYIGFIVFTELASIADIITWSEGVKKDVFRKKLVDKISLELKQKHSNGNEIYDLDVLMYEQSAKVHIVLLLFNVETYLRSDPNYRFPFDRLNTKEWSLEHIHPQNPADFETCNELIVWAEDSLSLLTDKKIPQSDGAVTKLQELAGITDEGAINPTIKKLAAQVADDVAELLDTHSLANLALLDQPTNSKLSNKPFRSKREILLEMDIEGSSLNKSNTSRSIFIPVCTKNVFLKYYSKNINQLHYWGHEDRKAYLTAIKNHLKHFIN